jgi:hypothetical protein
VFDAHLDGSLGDVLESEAARKLSKDLAGLTPEEAAVLALLSRRLATSAIPATAKPIRPSSTCSATSPA